MRDRQGCVRAVRESLTRAAASMKRQADRHRRDVHYTVGDWVMLSTRNLRLAEGASRKLAPKWTGPFRIDRVVSPVAYRLELPERFRLLHPVFHVSLLRPHHGPVRSGPEAVFADADGADHFEVEEILTHRGRGRRLEFLVSWVGYPAHENRWLPLAEMEGCRELLQEYCTRAGLRV